MSRPAWSLQAAPTTVPAEIIGSRTISESQKSTLRTFAESWKKPMVEGTAEEISAARDILRKPLQSPGVTAVFRNEYGAILIEQMYSVIRSENIQSAVSAYAVLEAIRTPAAIDALLQQTDDRNQPDLAHRQAAAGRMTEAIRQVNLPEAKRSSLAREIASLVRQEKYWLVVQRELEALRELARADSSLFGIQVGAMKDVIDRVDRRAEDAMLLGAVANLLREVIPQYIELPKAEQQTVNESMRQMLMAALQVCLKQWEKGHTEAGLRPVYTNVVQRAEVLLGQVTPKPSDGSLVKAWTSGDKAKFEAALSAKTN